MSYQLFRPSNCAKFQVPAVQIIRNLSLQEHECLKLLTDNGIKTPRFGVANSDKDAEIVARDLLNKNLMVKAQVLMSARSLGKFTNGFKSGVHPASCPEEVRDIASKMIGQRLVTSQSGHPGKICNKVMITERKFARREFYFAIALHRNFDVPVVIAAPGSAPHGAVSSKEVAKHPPEAIFYEINKKMTDEMASWIARRVGICDQPDETIKMLKKLYEFFMKKDVLMAEINPWIEDVCMNYYATNVKLIFDRSARERQWEIFGKNDETQEDARKLAARKLDVTYVPLDGKIGCLVNGSGLGMATNDIIKFYNGSPANFLDTGSMADAKKVKESIGIILMDPKIRTILVNINAGIIRCDDVVEGLIKAIREFDIKIPIVVRLQGNMYKEGLEIIKKSKLDIITVESFSEAAKMAVRCSKIVDMADEGGLDVVLKMKLDCDCKPIKPSSPVNGSNNALKSGKSPMGFQSIESLKPKKQQVVGVNLKTTAKIIKDEKRMVEKSKSLPEFHKTPASKSIEAFKKSVEQFRDDSCVHKMKEISSNLQKTEAKSSPKPQINGNTQSTSGKPQPTSVPTSKSSPIPQKSSGSLTRLTPPPKSTAVPQKPSGTLNPPSKSPGTPGTEKLKIQILNPVVQNPSTKPRMKVSDSQKPTSFGATSQQKTTGLTSSKSLENAKSETIVKPPVKSATATKSDMSAKSPTTTKSTTQKSVEKPQKDSSATATKSKTAAKSSTTTTKSTTQKFPEKSLKNSSPTTNPTTKPDTTKKTASSNPKSPENPEKSPKDASKDPKKPDDNDPFSKGDIVIIQT